MQWLHASQCVGDHGYGAGCHQGDVVRRAAQGKGVVGRACEAYCVVGLQWLALMVVLVLQLLLLHLQGHQLLTLQVGHIVGGGGCISRGGVALWSRNTPVGLMPSLVFLVVECGESKDVEKEQGCSHCYGDAELCGVVPLGFDNNSRLVCQLSSLTLVTALLGVGRWNPGVAGSRWPVVFTRETLGIWIWGGVLGRYLSGGGHVLEKFIYVMEMWNKLQPKCNLGCAVVVSNSRFEADVKVQLVFRVVLSPGYLLKSVGFCVDKLCILWNWLIWISERETHKYQSTVWKQTYSLPTLKPQ